MQGGEQPTARQVSLLQGTVTPDTSGDPQRQFCFSVSSPDGAFELQAENAVEQAEWVAALQASRFLHMFLAPQTVSSDCSPPAAVLLQRVLPQRRL